MQIVSEIAKNGPYLVQVLLIHFYAKDPFGNYVVQYVLDLDDLKYAEMIITPFLGKITLLSMQKFSSNVIEKVLFSG